MKKIVIKYLGLVALALVLTTVSGAAAQAACLDKRTIQQNVSSGAIKSLNDVLAAANIDRSQEILSVQVCEQGGRLVYILGVLSPDGQAKNLTVNAQ